MPLLMATSAFHLVRRRKSPQHCYLYRLCTVRGRFIGLAASSLGISTKLLYTSGPVSTGMDDRLRRANRLGMLPATQANSASYPHRDGKLVSAKVRRCSIAAWGDMHGPFHLWINV